MRRIFFFFLAAVFLGAGVYLFYQDGHTDTGSLRQTSTSPVSGAAATMAATDAVDTEDTADTAVPTEEPALLPEDLNTILDHSETVPLDTIPSSITALVNRNYLLPSSYVPATLVEPHIRFSFSYSSDKRKLRKIAADALEEMFLAAEKKGVVLYGVSGYRSYIRQKQIYDQNVIRRGRAATDSVSATPGSSEHQTGLTMDISAASVGLQLDQRFGDTKEGRWVAKNAHKYGYIVRYPYGKAKITGYTYEPWHIRYVGIATATYLYKNGLTLEEYYGVSGNHDEEKSGVDVEEPDAVKYVTPKPSGTNRESNSEKTTASPSPEP